MTKFERYVEAQFHQDHPGLAHDDIPDAYDAYLSGQSPQEWFTHANTFIGKRQDFDCWGESELIEELNRIK